jgi:hypothetical protein
MPEKRPRLLVTIFDALLVIVFCAVSLAATTGIIPTATSRSEAPADRAPDLSTKPAQPEVRSSQQAQSVIARMCTGCGVVSAVNVVEKQANKGWRWDVIVHMDDGSRRSYSFDSEPAFRPGDKVQVVNGKQMV